MAPGTTLETPVTAAHQPDLSGSLHEINEYLQKQGAYDLFDYLLKELLTKLPDDPLQHMVDCLRTEYPLGPLKVIVSSVPGVGRKVFARRLAEHFGLEYISSGELLRSSELGADGADLLAGGAPERAVSELVMERIREATANLRGWVLDGFPRTRFQATFFKEHAVVPTHVLVLKASLEHILERQRQIAEGELEGDHVNSEELERKLRLHSCHASSALETFGDKITVVQMTEDEDAVWTQLESTVRKLPRSKGPGPPPRVVIIGPRGSGVREHASRLAARLGAVFVDAAHIGAARQLQPSKEPRSLQSSRTSMDLPNLEPLVGEDKLGVVGVRLRQPDCTKQGWVLCGFPLNRRDAQLLHQDRHLAPTRVVILDASVDTCIRRIRLLLYDPQTGTAWTSLPKSEKIRKRLERKPEDQPGAVAAVHTEFLKALKGIKEVLGEDARCAEIPADGPPEALFHTIVDFVERPLSLPPRESA